MFLNEIKNLRKESPKIHKIHKYEKEYENFKDDIRDSVKKYPSNKIIVKYTDYNKYDKFFLLYLKKRLECEGFKVDVSIRGQVRIEY